MVSNIQDIAPGTAKMKTGIVGLDHLLGGGFLHGNSVLLLGTPGSGKSAIGLQILVNGILLYNEPGLIVSFEQFPQQLYRDALSFGWNLEEMERTNKLRVIFARRDDLYSSFPEKESDAITHITDAAIDLKARRLLLDSASMFWRLPLSQEEQRKIFFEFVMKLKGLEITPILTSELHSTGEEFAPEEFAVDTILKLEHTPAAYAGGYRPRSLEVVKARAQRVIEGKHPFRILPEGVRVSPYIHLDMSESGLDKTPDGTCALGIHDLDELMGGGPETGTTTMIAGMTGTGKTTLAAHFMAAGLAAGEAGIFVCLNERPSRLIRNMDKRGLNFGRAAAQGKLEVLHISGTGLQLMEFYYELRSMIQKNKTRRVVIDGLRDFLRPAATDDERNYFLTVYRELLRHHGVTSVFTWNINEVAGLSSLAGIPHSAMMDNILYIGLLELESRLRKVISVFKSRGHYADSSLRELIIAPNEVRISNLFTGISGILMGSATGVSTEITHEILRPLLHIRDFVNAAEIKTPEQTEMVVETIRREFNTIAEKAARHCGYLEEEKGS